MMTRWAMIDRRRLLDLRNERSAELMRLSGGKMEVAGLNHSLHAARLLGTIDALDVIIEATKSNSVAGGVA